jgi:hypothetical protein
MGDDDQLSPMFYMCYEKTNFFLFIVIPLHNAAFSGLSIDLAAMFWW